jgi:hypothetical protein
MARGRLRWSSKSLRRVFPLKAERWSRPRSDGWYGLASDEMRLRFGADSDVEFAGEVGTWSIDGGVLRLSTPGWQCEGALDASTAYLLCSPQGRVADRVELELGFQPDT